MTYPTKSRLSHISNPVCTMTVGLRGATRIIIVFIIAIAVLSSPIFMFMNPAQVSAAISNNSNRIDSSGYHSTPSIPAATASPLSSPTPMVPAVTNQANGGDFIAQAPLTGVSARQTNNIVGVQSYYDVVFTTSTTGTIKFIDITFPAGTVIGATPLLVEREGIGAGTAAKSSATGIRYTVTSAVSVPAGTQIRLEFFNIVNPTLPSTGYKVTVTTRNAGGTAIDGPTLSNSLNMKQIGSGQIADGAITSTKPAESFMKQVQLFDDAAGNDAGWNPDGSFLTFSINPAPGVSGTSDNFIVLMQGEPIFPYGCEVPWPSISFEEFNIACETAPQPGASLKYLSIHVPNEVVS